MRRPEDVEFHYLPAAGEAFTPRDEADLIRFWLDEGALPNEITARARLPQVVMLARDGGGRIAGVCTAVAQCPAPLHQPVYYYRSFIGQRFRHTRLVYNLLVRACARLEERARATDWPCIGVLLELENARFGKRGRMPVWPKLGFTYIGRSSRGLDLRIRYFQGAKLRDS